jgi:hypothetical protein
MRISLLFSSLIFFSLIVTPLAQAQISAQFLLEPANTQIASGNFVELTVTMNTGESKVNSYAAELNYPADKLTFESINTEGSPFTMALESKGGNGKVSIIRGTTTAVSGEALIGKISFKANSSVNTNEITISNNSAIISSDNKNILPGSTVIDNSTHAPSNEPRINEPTQPSPNPVVRILNSIIKLFSSIFK